MFSRLPKGTVPASGETQRRYLLVFQKKPTIKLGILFADGLTLVYHEARHVRFLIRDAHIAGPEWDNLVRLPKNRIAAWKGLQSLRQVTAGKSNALQASEIFRNHFRRDLHDLERLYANPHWKHAGGVGGHAWRKVTDLVSRLGEAIDHCDPSEIEAACAQLLQASHNNGRLCEKIIDLDGAIGIVTDESWHAAKSVTNETMQSARCKDSRG
jgi:hypothetical protein